MNFEDALRDQIESRPRLGLKGRRIRAILDARPSKRRTRQLERMEAHAAAVVGKPAGAIDWSAVNWPALFEKILAVLLAILPFLV